MTVDNLPTYIPLDEAAATYRLDRDVLTQAVENDIIRAVKTTRGGILVAEGDVVQITSHDQLREQFKHLRGVGLGIAEAARKYGIPNPTISRWAKAGYIARIGTEGQKVLVDEADVAYCAEVYRLQGGKQGKRIFDKNGRPYQLKHPERIRRQVASEVTG